MVTESQKHYLGPHIQFEEGLFFILPRIFVDANTCQNWSGSDWFIHLTQRDYELLMPGQLFEDGLYKLLSHYQLVSSEDRFVLEVNEASSVLGVYLEITNRCNFSCPQCAVGIDQQRKNENGTTENGTMTQDTLNNHLRRIFQSAKKHRKESINLKFSGGEPLLPIVVSLIWNSFDLLEALSRETGIKVHLKILTNGVFISRHIQQLIDAHKRFGLFVSVSMWDDPEHNEVARSYENPAYTKQILEGVYLLKQHDIPSNMNIVLTPENAERFPNIVRSFVDPQADNFLLKGKWGLPIPFSISSLRPQNADGEQKLRNGGYEKMARAIIEVIQLLKKMNYPVPLFIDLIDLLRNRDEICGCGSNYIAIGPKGSTVPCHQMLQDVNAAYIPGENDDYLTFANAQDPSAPKKTLNVLSDVAKIKEPVWQTLAALSGGFGCPRLWNEDREDPNQSFPYYQLFAIKILPHLLEYTYQYLRQHETEVASL